jgi:hypothetical protein
VQWRCCWVIRGGLEGWSRGFRGSAGGFFDGGFAAPYYETVEVGISGVS